MPLVLKWTDCPLYQSWTIYLTHFNSIGLYYFPFYNLLAVSGISYFLLHSFMHVLTSQKFKCYECVVDHYEGVEFKNTKRIVQVKLVLGMRVLRWDDFEHLLEDCQPEFLWYVVLYSLLLDITYLPLILFRMPEWFLFVPVHTIHEYFIALP